MPCFHPIQAYRGADGGPITFKEGGDSGPGLELPCGRCIGCRKARTREWTTRIMNEAAMHDANSFVTLTYDENHNAKTLAYPDFQKFIRALRRTRPVRFFVAGEYGEQTYRPHWHAILFGVSFRDTYPVGKDLYASKELEKLWPHGQHSIGEVNQTTAGYTASYCIKKITGPKAEEHYKRIDPQTGEIIQLEPEMARMSLKPGIGETWYKKYKAEIHYARDGIIQPGGRKTKVPRYYDKILDKENIQRAMEIETERQLNAKEREKDNTIERLKTREIVEIANHSRKQRQKI